MPRYLPCGGGAKAWGRRIQRYLGLQRDDDSASAGPEPDDIDETTVAMTSGGRTAVFCWGRDSFLASPRILTQAFLPVMGGPFRPLGTAVALQ